MRKQILFRLALGGLLIIVPMLATLFAIMPAHASSNLQEGTPGVVVTVEPPEVEVIPDTGDGDRDVFLSGWLIWVILGVVVLALLVGFVWRPWYTPPPPHHHDTHRHHDHE